MISNMDVFFCWISITILKIAKWLPEFVIEWANETLEWYAWTAGYITAITELEGGISSHLYCLERIQANRPTLTKEMLIDAGVPFQWDNGYDRAVLLWRLGTDPRMAFEYNSPFANPDRSDGLDGAVYAALDGDIKADPRRWENVDGSLKEDETDLATDIHHRYLLYKEGIQQLKGNYIYKRSQGSDEQG